MIRARAALAVALLLGAAPAPGACPPPVMLLHGVRAASRVQVEQLGATATRADTPLAHVPGRTLGYEVEGVFWVTGPAADALERAFGRNDSYACGPDAPRATFHPPGALQIGLLFTSHGSPVVAVLHLPEGTVELQIEGGERVSAPLSQAGQRRWEEALLLLARDTRASPDEFYEQMLPPAPGHPPEVGTPAPHDTAVAPDSVRAPRDDANAPR